MVDRIRVLVADDEPFNLKRLARLLEEAGCEVVAALGDGSEVLDWFQRGGEAEAAFLDIEMPGPSGLEASADLPAGVARVFVTAHAEHAVRAFEVDACDYLLKPVTADRLAAALARVRTRLARPQGPGGRSLPRVAVRAGTGTVFLDLGKVSHFTLESEAVLAWSGESHRTLWHTLAEVEEAFPDRGLIRANRQTLIRPEAVLGVRTLAFGRMLARMAGGQEVAISRGAAPALKARLGLPERTRQG